MRKILYLITIAVIALSAALFIGCSSDYAVSFGTDRITLFVGESRVLTPYLLFSPPSAGEKQVTFSLSGDCVELNGSTVTAVKIGEAEITAKAGDSAAKLTVEVKEQKATYLDIEVQNAVQTVLSPTPALFTALTDGDPAKVKWRVSGDESEGQTYSFTPTGYGEYTVTASIDELYTRCTVAVYRPTHTEMVYSGTLTQSGAFSKVSFTALETIDTRNPSSVFEWRVNGKKSGEGVIFDFEPIEAGQYQIELYVNGVKCAEATVEAMGSNAPTGEVVFDDMGGVFVRRTNSAPLAFVSLIYPDGKRITFDTTDAQYAHLFSDELVRLTEYIEVAAEDPGEYTIILGGYGRGEATFTQYPLTAQDYIKRVVLAKNSFISSGEDARDWVKELYLTGARKAACYSAIDIDAAIAAIRDSAAELNLSATIEFDGRIITIELGEYVNAPTENKRVYAVNHYTQLPHIEYAAEYLRYNGYVFGADRRTRDVSVESSEQLLYAVTEGYRPNTVTGSVAARIYRNAKNILLGIIGRDYTDREKVHAIYDWLQWVTVDANNAARNNACNYLESVFGATNDEADETSGMYSRVSSEGMAKLFAFLCGIEGIECEIVCAGSYRYNRVRLDGVWYNVDAYGGKIRSNSNVITSHRGLLLSGAEMSQLGVDGVGAFYSDSVYLDKYTFGGEYFDYYIDGAEQADYAMIKAAVYLALEGAKLGNVSILFVNSIDMRYNNTAGAEFFVGEGVNEEAFVSAVTRAANEYAAEKYGAAFGERFLSVTAHGKIVRLAATVSAGDYKEE